MRCMLQYKQHPMWTVHVHMHARHSAARACMHMCTCKDPLSRAHAHVTHEHSDEPHGRAQGARTLGPMHEGPRPPSALAKHGQRQGRGKGRSGVRTHGGMHPAADAAPTVASFRPSRHLLAARSPRSPRSLASGQRGHVWAARATRASCGSCAASVGTAGSAPGADHRCRRPAPASAAAATTATMATTATWLRYATSKWSLCGTVT